LSISFQEAVIVISEAIIILSPGFFLSLFPETIQPSKTFPFGAVKVFSGSLISSLSPTLISGILPLPPFDSNSTLCLI